MPLVFVYGTLLCGNSNHYLLRNCRCLGSAEAADLALYQVHPCYPGAVPFSGSRVRGEVYEVDNDKLRQLDDLEDNDILYRRQLLPVRLLSNGETLSCWVYLWLGEVDPAAYIPVHIQPWRESR